MEALPGKERPDGLLQCLGIVGSEGFEACRVLWNDEMTRHERRVFLIAARLPMNWDGRAWGSLSDTSKVEIRRSMIRFKKRFFPLLEFIGESEA